MNESSTEDMLVLPDRTGSVKTSDEVALAPDRQQSRRLVTSRGRMPSDPGVERFPVPLEEREQLPALDPDASDDLDQTRVLSPIDGELPGHARPGVMGIVTFFVIVVIPVLACAYYYFAVASDQYVSEFRFMVTQSTPATLTTPMSSTAGAQGASSMLGALGVANLATAQNYIVTDYLSSAQAVQDLEARIKLSKMFSHPSIDFLSRFDASKPVEQLTRFWQKMLSSRYDPVTGIATADIRAFSPTDAKLIATTLVSLSEELVNRIDMRAKLDAVRFAQDEVQRAEDRVKAARAALTEFRNAEGVIDPTASIVAGNIQDVAATRATLIQLQTQLGVVRKQHVSSSSPIEASLQAKISATQDQLDSLQREVGKSRGSDAVLTSLVGRYEQLDLDRQYANGLLVSAMQSLDQARVAAGSQDLYLTPYVTPALPESSTYPNRFQSVALFVLVCFGVWGTLGLLYRAIRDRS